ncbi:MAG: cytochrome c1 [Steroidobacteraceae bacterium]
MSRSLGAALALLAVSVTLSAEEQPAEAAALGADWRHWTADTQIENLPSLQRGARNFMAYCYGCHSLKFLRYQRMADDLKIPGEQLQQYLLPPGAKSTDYVITPMPAQRAADWFGKAPPDLSLIARARGTDYLFRFLTTFYADTKSVGTGVNNLALPGTAMPHVLSPLQGVQQAVFQNVEKPGEDGKPMMVAEFAHFEPGANGSLDNAQYREFVRDTVNFLDYAGEPSRLGRGNVGVWTVLFLLLFTVVAWLLKHEYWKDVR